MARISYDTPLPAGVAGDDGSDDDSDLEGPLPVGARNVGLLRVARHAQGAAFGGTELRRRLLRSAPARRLPPAIPRTATRAARIERDLNVVRAYKTLQALTKMPMWHPVETAESIRASKTRAAQEAAAASAEPATSGILEATAGATYQEQNARYFAALRAAATGPALASTVAAEMVPFTGPEIKRLSETDIQEEWSNGTLELDHAGKDAMDTAIFKIQEILTPAGITCPPDNPTPEMWLKAVAGKPHLINQVVQIAYAIFMEAQFGSGTQIVSDDTRKPALVVLDRAALSIASPRFLKAWDDLYKEQAWPTESRARTRFNRAVIRPLS